jgi:hypothetical protein
VVEPYDVGLTMGRCIFSKGTSGWGIYILILNEIRIIKMNIE